MPSTKNHTKMKIIEKLFPKKDPIEAFVNSIFIAFLGCWIVWGLVAVVFAPKHTDISSISEFEERLKQEDAKREMPYTLFKQAIKNNEMVIYQRDSLFSYKDEIVYAKNTKTGMKYKMWHRYKGKDVEFEKQEEYYELIKDVDGNYIFCWSDTNKIILNFLNKK